MAKFVGKIFKTSNNVLGVRGSGAHYFKVTWYNPFKRKFHCKVITSLEKTETVELKQKRQKLKNKAYVKKDGKDNEYCVFNRNKFEDLRKGEITPIPVSQTQGFPLWSGYMGTADLSLSEMRKAKPQPKKSILEK